MTRKDYVLIAQALKQAEKVNANYYQWKTDVHAIMGALQDDNPRFNPDKFWQACSK